MGAQLQTVGEPLDEAARVGTGAHLGRDRRHRRGVGFEPRDRLVGGTGHQLRDDAAGRADARRIGQHAERDDARDLLRIGQVAGDVVGDLARLQRHDPNIRLTDVVAFRDLEPAVADDAGDVELSAALSGKSARGGARIRARRSPRRSPLQASATSVPIGPSPAICNVRRSRP